MSKRLSLSVVFMLCLAVPLAAETLAFRGGILLAAELSTRKPAVQQENKYAFKENFDQKIYAALTVKMTRGRGLSIYDYSIQAFGTTYPCVAIRTGNGDFNAADWEIRNPDPARTYTLLFVLDGRQVGLEKIENLKLQCNFPPSGREFQNIPLNNLGSRAFTAPDAIPAAGLMQVAK